MVFQTGIRRFFTMATHHQFNGFHHQAPEHAFFRNAFIRVTTGHAQSKHQLIIFFVAEGKIPVSAGNGMQL